MWPWEHLAFGYLLYSASVRARGERPPDAPALALAVGTQLPDLVDKSLAWGLGVLPAGVLLHALPVALPLLAVALVVARRLGRAEVGVALAVGHLSHLLGDVLYPLVVAGEVGTVGLLWPLVDYPTGVRRSILANVVRYGGRYVAHLATPRGTLFVALEVGLLAAALLVWLADGRPGPAALRALGGRVPATVRRG